MAIRHPDTIAGAALIAAAGAVALLSLQVGRGPAMNTLPANFFPLLCAGGLALAGAALLVSALRSSAAPLPRILEARVVGVGLLMVLYFGTFEYMDFRLGAWLFSLLSMLVMGNRSIPQLIIVPLAVSLGIYVTFRHLFTILLPVWT
ncbi:MAG TPA: tripartite tricarboxylate transporter TctB family protein [Geminicoccaceae bacterium]